MQEESRGEVRRGESRVVGLAKSFVVLCSMQFSVVFSRAPLHPLLCRELAHLSPISYSLQFLVQYSSPWFAVLGV